MHRLAKPTGTAGKRLKGQDGEVSISVPRDRGGSFEPELVKKGQARIDGVDDKITGLCAAGLTVRDIRAHLSSSLWENRKRCLKAVGFLA